MSFKTKTQREAAARHQALRIAESEAKLEGMLEDFGNFMLAKLRKDGILDLNIAVSQQDIDEFKSEIRNRLLT